jgi:hypothetical protein
MARPDGGLESRCPKMPRLPTRVWVQRCSSRVWRQGGYKDGRQDEEFSDGETGQKWKSGAAVIGIPGRPAIRGCDPSQAGKAAWSSSGCSVIRHGAEWGVAGQDIGGQSRGMPSLALEASN